jgi:NitT/TauT family transport system substrate-binding protein
MKRALAAAAILSLGLAACGGSAPPAPASPSAPPASSPAAKPSAAAPASSAAAKPAGSASAKPAAAASGAALEKVVMRASWTAKAEDAPFWLALDKGYYKDQGLDVQYLSGTGSGNTVKTVASKTDTFGYADGTTMAQAMADGTPTRAIAGILQRNPIGMAVKPDIKTPKDLAGKTLITTAASGPAQLFPVFAQGAGIDPSKVKVADVAANAQLSSFLAGKGDAVSVFVNNDVQVLQAQAGEGKFNVFPYADYGVDVLNMVIFAHNDTIQQKPDVVKKFLAATMHGYADMIADPKAAADDFMKHNPSYDRAVLDGQLKATLPLLHSDATKAKPLGFMADSDWTSTLDVLQKYAKLAKRLPNNDYYTNQFLPS